MKQTISLKIDVSKIEKDRLFKGAKGTYLDAVLFLNDEPDEYGNSGMITQSVSKEERAAGVKGAILGNAKLFGAAPPESKGHKAKAGSAADVDDLPFHHNAFGI